MSDIQDFFGKLKKITDKDCRYKEEAYLFVMAALSRTVKSLQAPRHIKGNELLEGIRREAEEQYGPMAQTVFAHWGIKNSLDFGHIVFNMVHEGILSKTETDSLEDFKDAIFFQKLFDALEGYRLRDEEKTLKGISKITS